MTAYERQPNKLVHYTTLSGFYGIVQSGCLWASNALYLNDKVEIIHALEAIKRLINEEINGLTGGEYIKSQLKDVLLEPELFGGPDLSGHIDWTPQYYVSCFCEEADNLSQWRAYGGSGQGVSISFDVQKIRKLLKSGSTILSHVDYVSGYKSEEFYNMFNKNLFRVEQISELIGGDDVQTRNELRNMVFKILPKVKHVGFSSENEWRIIAQKSNGDHYLKFRISGDKFIPYIEVLKSTASDNMLLPIESICIGPGLDQNLTRRSVELFMVSHGYRVNVSSSVLPFRL